MLRQGSVPVVIVFLPPSVFALIFPLTSRKSPNFTRRNSSPDSLTSACRMRLEASAFKHHQEILAESMVARFTCNESVGEALPHLSRVQSAPLLKCRPYPLQHTFRNLRLLQSERWTIEVRIHQHFAGYRTNMELSGIERPVDVCANRSVRCDRNRRQVSQESKGQ